MHSSTFCTGKNDLLLHLTVALFRLPGNLEYSQEKLGKLYSEVNLNCKSYE